MEEKQSHIFQKNIEEAASLEAAVAAWLELQLPEERSDAFAALCDSYGFAEVMPYLAGIKWEQRVTLGRALQDVAYFNYLPRPATKKKTIAAYYRSIANGGAQRVVALLCNRWAEMRDFQGEYLYNVVLITDAGPQDDEYDLSPLVKRAYLPAYENSNGDNYHKRFAAWQQILTAYAIDVVVSSMWVAFCTFWDLLSVKGHPSHPAFLIHSHNSCAVPFSYDSSEVLELSYKYQLCDGVVALSSCDELYIKCFNANAQHIVNPLAFKPELLPKSSYEANTILWCARISEEKQPLDAVRAMAAIVKEIPEAKLYVVGDGEPVLQEAMQNEAVRLGVEQNIEFAGFTLDVAKYYSRASVMLLTSEYEGFCLTIGEALAYGLPVVSYELPNLSFMQDGRGIATVPQGRHDLLAQKTVELLKNPSQLKALGDLGKTHITEVAHADIEGAWRQLFAKLDKPKAKVPPSDIQTVLSMITEFQYKGRCKSIANWESLRDGILKEKYKYKYLAEKRQEGLDFWRTRGPELLKEQAELKKRLRAAEKKLHDVENGLSFKLGRILTFLPRKLFGKK